jgi:pyruvate/2-oxoacid:ferredoxin oxidoreductase alpha subunit
MNESVSVAYGSRRGPAEDITSHLRRRRRTVAVLNPTYWRPFSDNAYRSGLVQIGTDSPTNSEAEATGRRITPETTKTPRLAVCISQHPSSTITVRMVMPAMKSITDRYKTCVATHWQPARCV